MELGTLCLSLLLSLSAVAEELPDEPAFAPRPVPESQPTAVDEVGQRPASAPATGFLRIAEQKGRPVRVVVDGQDRGAAPWAGEMEPGRHVVELRGDMSALPPRIVEVRPGERLELVLAAELVNGMVRLAVSPKQAHIAIDGRARGAGGWNGALPAGLHQIAVTFAKHQPHHEAFELRGGETLVRHIALSPTTGRLRIAVVPDTARLFVNDEPVAATDGRWDGELEQGRHVLTARADGYHPSVRQVNVLPGEVISERLTLVPEANRDGPYFDLTLNGGFQPTGQPDICQELEVSPGYAKCLSFSGTPSVGLTLRLGYRYRYYAGEVVASGFSDIHYGQLPAPRPTSSPIPLPDEAQQILDELESQRFLVYNFGAFLGAGPRITTPGRLRFTFGLAGGLALRWYNLSYGPIKDQEYEGLSQRGFALLGDAALLIGNPAGTQIMLGMLLWVDFCGKQPEVPTEALDGLELVTETYPVGRSPSVFMGPAMGLRWGG